MHLKNNMIYKSEYAYIDSIVFVTGHYPPPENAAGFRLRAMVKAILKNLNMNVLIIDLARSKVEQYIGDYGEKIISPRVSHPSGSKLYYFYRLKNMIDLSKTYYLINKCIRKLSLKPRLIISTIPPGESVEIGLKLARQYEAKLLIDFHDLTDEWKIAENPLLGAFYKWYFNKYVYGVLDKADAITATTEYAVHYIRRKTKGRIKRIFVIYNGVHPSDFNKAYAMKTKGYSDELRIIFVGNLNWKYHKLDLFIKAMKEIDLKKYKFKFVIIGKGKYLNSYISLAKKLNLEKRITFTGYVTRQKLLDELGRSDFGLIPRPNINNPWVIASDRITFYEYLASGMPVIAYGPDINYMGYIIEKYGLGIYIRSNDHKFIASKIIENIDYLTSIHSSYIRNYILKYRDWDKIMNKFINIIQRILFT